MSNLEHLVEVRNVSTEFPGRRGSESVLAVDDVSLSLPTDKAVLLTIVGESGSGKTTLTRNLLGLTPPTVGKVLYKGKDIYALTAASIASTDVKSSRCFKTPTLLTTRSTASITCWKYQFAN